MFEKEFSDLGDLSSIIEETKKGIKWHIDTVEINKIILQRAGLKPENIIDSGICSVCNKEIIHSYRAEGKEYKFKYCDYIFSLKIITILFKLGKRKK